MDIVLHPRVTRAIETIEQLHACGYRAVRARSKFLHFRRVPVLTVVARRHHQPASAVLDWLASQEKSS